MANEATIRGYTLMMLGFFLGAGILAGLVKLVHQSWNLVSVTGRTDLGVLCAGFSIFTVFFMTVMLGIGLDPSPRKPWALAAVAFGVTWLFENQNLAAHEIAAVQYKEAQTRLYESATPHRTIDKEAGVVCYERREIDGSHPSISCVPLSQTKLKADAS